jgi:hypothetical protein
MSGIVDSIRWHKSRQAAKFLIPLAVHGRLTNDPRITTLVLGIIFSWMKGNRPYRGVNWISGIELALRAISVAVALSIVGLKEIEVADRIDIERFFSAHLFWIRRYPSLHSSGNNHRIAELAGALVCATFAPGIDSEENLKKDLNELMLQLEAQFLADGVGAEQSPTYGAFSIDLALATFAPLNLAPERQWISDGKVVGIEGSAGPRYVVSIAECVTNYLNRPSSPSRCHLDLRDVIFFPQKASSIPSHALR